MAVLFVADIPGMTREMYKQGINQIRDQMKEAPGFMAHAGTPTANGFRVTEIWESAEDANRWVESAIIPTAQQIGLPPFEPQIVEADEAFTA